jgi:hypothetical protein
LIHGGCLEGFPEQSDFFGAERLEREQVEDGRRIFLQELGAELVVAGLENFLDMLGHAVADAGQGSELLGVAGELLDGLGEAADEFGAALVAAVAADDGAVNFQELRGFAKNALDLAVFHTGPPAATGRARRRRSEAPRWRRRIR